MFARLIHCDWSVAPGKRWLAVAHRQGDRGSVSDVRQVGAPDAFLRLLNSGERTLAGFDFPIGLPVGYGNQTGLTDFKSALPRFGTGHWAQFFEVAGQADEVALNRPFYPKGAIKGSRRQTLVDGLGVDGFDALLRACERATGDRRAACSVFWTLGGNQVGRGAISGWREVIRPAMESGAALWPFDGSLSALADRDLVLAETYPAEAYGVYCGRFSSTQSKRKQADRRAKRDAILCYAARYCIRVADDVRSRVEDGFGPAKSGEDPFDAFAGLLLMIEVVDGRRNEFHSLQSKAVDPWEGWILGV